MKCTSHFRSTACALALLTALAAGPVLAQQYSDGSSYTPANNWAGLYAGVHFGDTWGDFHHDGNAGPSGDSNSLMGGGQVGYNVQYNHFVYGAEGDISKLDFGKQTNTSNFDEDWMMTFRGRAGYALGQFLPYVTAGLAVTDTNMKVPGAGSDSNLEPGLAAGGGVDTKLSDRWIGRVEYLYTDVPKDTSNIGGTNVTGGSHNNTIRIGLNYLF